MTAAVVRMPFPPAALSGHTGGHWRGKSTPTKKWRGWAVLAALEAKIPAQPDGDIPLLVRFYPPHNRGDRTNYGNRCKPIYDGIAQAMGVNDRRFVPRYEYCDAEKPGRVEIVVGALT